MPIWLRKFNIQQINEYTKKQNEEIKKSQGQSNIGDDKVLKPGGINPSSTYNF